MKKSFEIDNVEGTVEAVLEAQAPAVQKTTLDRSDALAVAAEQAGLEGDFQMADFKVPYLQIVQPTSDSEFPMGSVIFNKDFQLSDGSAPVAFTVLGLKKEYVEDLPYESEETPRRWPTEAAAKADGFFTAYGCDNYAKPEAQMTLLIPCDDDLATHSFEGQGYVRAMWSVKGSAYTAAAKPIITAALSGHLRKGIFHGGWTITTFKKVHNKKTYFVPVLKSTGLHKPDFVEWVEKDLLIR
jgi:hypothetical protein